MTTDSPFLRSALLLAASLPTVLLAGCGMGNFSATGSPAPVINVASATGIFMGGQQPVGGVSLQLYAVGTTGYGSAATPLLIPGAAKTTAQGNFTLPSFTCPTAGSLVYLVGTGGQPIAATPSSPAVTNNNLALMVGLGACSAVGSSYINVNELTTVATVWALNPFMTGMANIGSSPSNTLGIATAFASINEVVNTANGQVSGPALPTGATLPISEINTLADILEQCVNSGGGAASDTTDGQTNGTGCGKLFFLTGGTADTITAAMQISQNAARNVAKLNILRSASPVFAPVLSVNAPPSDWTLAINFRGGGLNSPSTISVDPTGNIWVANTGNATVSEFNSTGTALSSTTGYPLGASGSLSAMVLDQAGNAWITVASSLVELSPTGNVLMTVTGSGLSSPRSIAIDATGNVFVANSAGNSVSAFSPSGTPLAGSPFTAGGITRPFAIAISDR